MSATMLKTGKTGFRAGFDHVHTFNFFIERGCCIYVEVVVCILPHFSLMHPLPISRLSLVHQDFSEGV